MYIRFLVLYILIMCRACAETGRADNGQDCPIVPLIVERLLDLNVPRTGHATFFVGGELTVTGGHTTNFVPTATAEYFADGEWHVVPMAYSHDNGFAVTMRSGEVIIGGGHDEPLGIGQTFMVERYIQTKHAFEGFGCLDRRRVLSNGIQLADGRVIIAGNHYADDAIACYDGRSQVQHVKHVVQARSNPYILPIADDDAIILGGYDQFDKQPDTVWVDRLKGDAFRVPLLEQWRLVYTDQGFNSYACAFHDSDISQFDYSYLLTATDKNGQLAIVMVTNPPNDQTTNHPNDQTTNPPNDQLPHFSLLPTVCPIPMHTQWGPIFYKGPVVVDSLRQRGYVLGVDSLCHHQYILAIDYARQPATLTLYHSDTMVNVTVAIPVLTPDGNLILAGGIHDNNYKPFATVFLCHFDTPPPAAAITGGTVWPWGVLALAIVAAFAYIIIYRHRRKGEEDTLQQETAKEAPIQDTVEKEAPQQETTEEEAPQQEIAEEEAPIREREMDEDKADELMEQICLLMEREQLYLNSDLRLQDVAVRIKTNSSYVSECINNRCSQSFSQFVNTYRVRHAQELLRRQPDMKTTTVATASGFNTESSFFRNFKTVTGMTPREWLQDGEKSDI